MRQLKPEDKTFPIGLEQCPGCGCNVISVSLALRSHFNYEGSND